MSIMAVTVHWLKNLLKVKVKTEVQNGDSLVYPICCLLLFLTIRSSTVFSFLNSWTFVVHQFQHRIANAVSSKQ